jgi:tetratricopeptide (TPR) repeat protein
MQLPGILGESKDRSLQYANELETISRFEGYLAKGYIYEYSSDPDLAEDYYKKALKEGKNLACSDNGQTTGMRNALHYQIGKVEAEYHTELEKGEACLQTYLENYTPKDGVPKAWAHYRLAQIYLYKKNKIQALKHIDLALAELPNIKPFKKEREKILNM